MKKFYETAAYCAFPLAFNLIFFLACGTRNVASVWISFAWINAAYALFVVCSVFPRAGKYSHIFGVVRLAVSLAYFAVSLVIGVVFIALKVDGIAAPLIAQIVPLALFVIVYSLNAITNMHTESPDSPSAQIK